MNTDVVHRMIRTFVGYGAPVVDDGVGANKADFPFFDRLANQQSIEKHELLEAAERFHKYRNTQLPNILADTGLLDGHADVSSFLLEMKKVGEEAKRKYEILQQLQSIQRKKEASTMSLLNTKLRGREDTFDEFMVNAVMLSHGLEKDEAEAFIKEYVDSWTPPASLTISVKLIDDVWKNKWGKEFKTKRIALTYAYNNDFNQALKQGLSFPKVKFDGSIKKWTLNDDKETLDTAVRILEEAGGFFDNSLAELRGEHTFTPKQIVKKVTNYTATLKGTTIEMKWPYIADPDVRMQVMAQVQATQGRKYNPDRKSWSVSIYQAPALIDRLNKQSVSEAKLLAEALETIPQIHTAMEERAKRIAISGASALDDKEMVAQMSDELAKHFPKGRELFPFQYVGVRFVQLAEGRALIGDDMGVGKTIQAIAYTALNQDKLPALVVCPSNVKYNWEKEFNAWLPNLSVSVVEGRSKGIIQDTDVVICNYDIMSGRKESLLDKEFNIVICDESHYVKNSKAQRTQATLDVAMNAESILCLSGTAITNRPNEFYTTLNLLRPAEFSNSHEYGIQYCGGFHTGWGWDMSGASNTDELHERTRDFCIRRLKKEVLDELPDKIRTMHTVKPSKKDLTNYNALHQSWIQEYEYHLMSGSTPKGFVLNMLTDLRHECGRIKVDSAVQWLTDYKEITGKPVVIFAHHQDVLKGIWDALNNNKQQWRGAVITGQVSASDRQLRVEAFQAGKLDVLLCSTVAAKEGITLTAADTVLFVEREWTPAWEEQAEDRVNRIGQDSSSVHAVYLSVAGTIDEKFNTVVEAKREVIKSILDGGDLDDRKGIATMLLQQMVADGDLPKTFIQKKKEVKV